MRLKQITAGFLMQFNILWIIKDHFISAYLLKIYLISFTQKNVIITYGVILYNYVKIYLCYLWTFGFFPVFTIASRIIVILHIFSSGYASLGVQTLDDKICACLINKVILIFFCKMVPN